MGGVGLSLEGESGQRRVRLDVGLLPKGLFSRL